MLREFCVEGIDADVERCQANLAASTALATELVPMIGYQRAAAVAAHAQVSGNLLESVEALEPELASFVRRLTAA
jgi:aspartate ammonia-lyase